jgi:hypothetical protein
MVKVIDLVRNSYAAVPNQKVCSELVTWLNYNFEGDENFEFVCLSIGGSMLTLSQYVTYLLSIPNMKYFLTSIVGSYGDGVFVSLLMSFDAFASFNETWHIVTDPIVLSNEADVPHIAPSPNGALPMQLFCSPCSRGDAGGTDAPEVLVRFRQRYHINRCVSVNTASTQQSSNVTLQQLTQPRDVASDISNADKSLDYSLEL